MTRVGDWPSPCPGSGLCSCASGCDPRPPCHREATAPPRRAANRQGDAMRHAMKRTLLVAPCLFVLACGGGGTASVDELRAAMPRHAWLNMSLALVAPPQQGATPKMCTASGASTFGTLTHQVAGT